VRRLDERLLDGATRDGATRVVLDNTYVTRATRNDVIRIAHGHGAEVRCIFFDTPQHEAQINVVRRMIARFGRVLDPADLVAPRPRRCRARSRSCLGRRARSSHGPDRRHCILHASRRSAGLLVPPSPARALARVRPTARRRCARERPVLDQQRRSRVRAGARPAHRVSRELSA
jgi:hypothetical protein